MKSFRASCIQGMPEQKTISIRSDGSLMEFTTVDASHLTHLPIQLCRVVKKTPKMWVRRAFHRAVDQLKAFLKADLHRKCVSFPSDLIRAKEKELQGTPLQRLPSILFDEILPCLASEVLARHKHKPQKDGVLMDCHLLRDPLPRASHAPHGYDKILCPARNAETAPQ